MESTLWSTSLLRPVTRLVICSRELQRLNSGSCANSIIRHWLAIMIGTIRLSVSREMGFIIIIVEPV